MPVRRHARQRAQSQALTGDLGPGSAERLAQALAQHPQVRRVKLESTRGLVTEALAMAQQVRVREMDTIVAVQCTGPCAVVFMAGAARTLQPGSHLAFFQAHAPILPFIRSRGQADDRVHTFLLSMGVPQNWADTMASSPAHEPWVPTATQLKGLGVQSAP